MKQRTRKINITTEYQPYQPENPAEEYVLSTYTSNGFYMIPKLWIKTFGLIPTILLSHYLEYYIFLKNKGNFDGEFYLTHVTVGKALLLTKHQIIKTKKELKELKLIKVVKRGLPAKDFITIDFEQIFMLTQNSGTSMKSSSRKFQRQGVKNSNDLSSEIPTTYYNNIYNDNLSKKNYNKKNTSNTSNSLLEDDKIIIPTKKITPKLFYDFWELYPKKIDEGKCLTLWIKICNRKNNVPEWSEIKKAIYYQKQSKRWQVSDYIPYPATWLNNSRWLDDPTKMNEVKFDYDKPKTKTTFGHLDAVTPNYEDDDSY